MDFGTKSRSTLMHFSLVYYKSELDRNRKDKTLNLNQQQIAAIHHYGSPQVIIAGAGTGKTTVMIEKINHLIQTNTHNPHEILALTFTNKAANEMKTRFESKRPGPNQPTFGTFHSFALRFLQNKQLF